MKFKKLTAALCAVLAVGMLAACSTAGKTEQVNGYTVNAAYNAQQMQTITGDTYVSQGNDATVTIKELGIGITLPEDMVKERQKEDSRISGVITDIAFGLSFDTEKLLSMFPSEEDFMAMSEEEQIQLFTDMEEYAVNLFSVVRVADDSEEQQQSFDILREQYAVVEELCRYDGATFYFAYNNDIDQWTLTDEEHQVLSGYLEQMDTIKDNLCVFKAVKADDPAIFEGTLQQFSAETVSGKEIDQSIFADYDITMVNVWATWCGYCVEELPDIQKLYEQLPENVNIISICTDASTETELAQSMIDETGIQFETLVDNDALEEAFIQYCDALPTTVFVDSQGNIIGTPQTGLPGEDVVAGYSALIDQALAMIGKGA